MKHPGDWRAYLVDVLEHGSRREKVAAWVWIAATVSTWIWCLALIPMLGWTTIILFVATPFVTLAELRWFLHRRKSPPLK